MKRKFEMYLKDIKYPTKEEKKEMWDVSGILKQKSNEHLKFDIRPMFKLKTGQVAKKGTFNTKADKIVFEAEEEYIVTDMQELINYVKNNKLKTVPLEDIVEKLEWNLILKK
tara:strand:+ start:2050 stop:2385 length:336 start_codon:yes stop_codon:yes gene_type:complete